MKFSSIRINGLLACIFALRAGAVLAQPAGQLYDPEPPLDSAYLRVVCPSEPKAVLVVDGVRRANPGNPPLGAAYMVMKAGPHSIGLSSGGYGQHAQPMEARQVVTLVCGQNGQLASGWTAWVDNKLTNRTKSLLALYVLPGVAGPISVKLADGSAEVFSAVPPGKSAALQVNPVKTDVQVFDGNQKPLGTVALDLNRGDAYSLWVVPSGASVKLTLTKNQIEPFKP